MFNRTKIKRLELEVAHLLSINENLRQRIAQAEGREITSWMGFACGADLINSMAVATRKMSVYLEDVQREGREKFKVETPSREQFLAANGKFIPIFQEEK